MSTLYVAAVDFDAIDPDEWQAVLAEAAVPVRLGEPARQTGDFDAEGRFVQADDGPEWVLWDDHRLGENHALAVAAALEV